MAQHQVYFNLHKLIWSIRHRGKVIQHTESVLMRNCVFHVSESGRQKVLADRRRRVHAWVKGELVDTDLPNPGLSTQVSYNPYKGPHFYNYETKGPVFEADLVYFGDRFCWVRE